MLSESSVPLKSLDDIAVECGTDKSSRWHSYTEYYHDLLSPLRHKPISLLEIGVDGGESIRMWSEFFTDPKSQIFGVDVHDKKGYLGRGRFFLGDATEPNMVFDITNETGPLDVILDDGSHRSNHLKATLALWWPHVAKGGLMIFEDLHAQYHYPWTDAGEVKFTDTLLPWIDRLNENGQDHRGVPSDGDVEYIMFRKSLAVFKKRS